MFTKENGAAFAAKARISRAANKALAADILAMARNTSALAQATQAQLLLNQRNLELDEFEAKTLARVRLQLDKISDMFNEATEAAELDRLASAQARLAEQERILSGRPLPGSLRPKQSKASKPISSMSTPEET